MNTPLVDLNDIPALSVDDYLGEESLFKKSCSELSTEENNILREELQYFLEETKRTHDEVVDFIADFIIIMFCE